MRGEDSGARTRLGFALHRITPTLWFDRNGEAAVAFYTSIFKNSKVHSVTQHTGAGPGPATGALVIHFQLDGQDFLALKGGPEFKFTCGWFKDRFGLSWQVVPTVLPKLLQDKDPQKRRRVMEAMMQMKKLNVDQLQRAHDEESFATV